MNKNIDTIIKELIAIDSSFAQHEKEMRTLIAEFLAKKPDTRLDEKFVASLRARLQGEPVPSPFYTALNFPYAVVGVLAVLLVVPLGYYAATHGTASSGSGVFAMSQEIEQLPHGAYGTLQAQDGGLGGSPESINYRSAGTAGTMTTMAAPSGASMPAASEPDVAQDAKISANMTYGSGGSDARMMIPQGDITVYNYIYKGEPLDLSGEGAVYNRVKNKNSSGQISAQLRKFNFGLADLSAYSSSRVRSFELVEDKPFGYAISVNFDEGMISINPEYTEWPSMNGKGGEIAQLPMSAMPSKEDSIKIANNFLKDHGINLDNYSDPVVQDYSQVALAADSQPQYAPEQVTVTYPLKINGTTVYEDGAYPYGIQVGVSVRDKRVMSVYGLQSQNYTSSSYTLETDSNKILSMVQKGGVHAWVPEESAGVTIKKVQVEVGSPEKILMHTYTYSNNESKELFVPALSFPVTSTPQGDQYYPRYILIPLVPELLNHEPGPVLYDMVR